MTKITHHDEHLDPDKTHKIESLRDMINNAEKTIQSAKAMLLQLEGKKKTGRKRKVDSNDEEGTVVEGTFDGQIMMGTDGKQYPVPANYASKSKLVEGDMLKLTITTDGSFIYKQIGPIERRHALGIVSQDEKGNYYIFSEGKPYKVLLASVTYFKAEPGDEVAIMIPRDLNSAWAAIENVLQKGGNFSSHESHGAAFDSWQEELKKEIPAKKETAHTEDSPALSKEGPARNASGIADAGGPARNASGIADAGGEISDEWTSEIDALEKEIRAQQF